MTSDRRDKGSHRIPIKFTDADDEIRSAESAAKDMAREDPDNEGEEISVTDESLNEENLFSATDVELDDPGAGPDKAELVATRSELKRVETENAELKDRFARRQADFDNYRKRVERERTETYNR